MLKLFFSVMGVAIEDIIPKQEIELASLRGKKVAVDAYNALYQFLSIIRQPDGTPLMDSAGRITSHLSGLFYRNAKLLEEGILPAYVFDGRPSELKAETVAERKETRKKAREEWEAAVEKGDFETARKRAQAAVSLDEHVLNSSIRLLHAMGIPVVQSPEEGEAQASFMAEKEDVYCVASQDYDCLLFGAPVLVRNINLTGRRKLPGKKVYVTIHPEIIILENVLSKNQITREQLVEIGILIGTDYNQGIKGIGPKKALALVKQGKKAEEVYKDKGISPEVDLEQVREVFLKPNVTKRYSLEWKDPDPKKIKKILVEEHDFSEERIEKTLNLLQEKSATAREQSSITRWFS